MVWERRHIARRFADVVRAKALVLVLVLNLALWAFVIVRYQTVDATNTSMMGLYDGLAAMHAEHKLDRETYGQRLDALEAYVYGTIQKAVDDKKRPITSAAEWQRNRDIQISKRLSALEDWRQRTEER